MPVRGKRSNILGLIDDNCLLDQENFTEIIKDFYNTTYEINNDEKLTLVYCNSKGEKNNGN